MNRGDRHRVWVTGGPEPEVAMTRTIRFLPAVIVLAFATGACGGAATTSQGAGPTQSGPTAAATSTPPAAGTPVAVAVSVAKRGPGMALVDGAGRSLYLFTKDTGSTSTCVGDCAKSWLPLLAPAGVTAGQGASAGELGSSIRPDGTKQVTYHGHPLYQYDDDKAPGDALGQNKNEFGGEWYLVTPQGEELEK